MRLFRQPQQGDWSGVVEGAPPCIPGPQPVGFQRFGQQSSRPSMKSFHKPLSDADAFPCAAHGIDSKLLRRYLEEQIISLVPLEEAWLKTLVPDT